MTMSGGDDEMVPRKDWTGTCRRWRRDVERRDGENEISDCRLRTGRMLGLYATCEASGRSAISAPARDAHPMLFNMTYGVRDGYRGSCAGLGQCVIQCDVLCICARATPEPGLWALVYALLSDLLTMSVCGESAEQSSCE